MEQQLVELRAPLSVDADHLAIEDGRAHPKRAAQLGCEPGELPKAVAVARDQLGASWAQMGERPEPVVLQLEQPLGMVERLAHAAERERSKARHARSLNRRLPPR